MGHSLDLTFVQLQGGFQQGFAVTGGTGVHNPGVFRQTGADLPDRADGGGQRASAVAAVERIQQGTVLSDQRDLGGGGACVDAKVTVALIGCRIRRAHAVPAVAGEKRIIFRLVFKKRFQPCHLEFHADIRVQFFEEGGERDGFFRCSVQGGADCGKKMRVFRCDRMVVIQAECADKGGFQFR